LKGYAEFPASSPYVVSVGGTRLEFQGENAAWGQETVWNGDGVGGGGCSLQFAAQPWQQGTSDWSSVGCGVRRGVADISADADPFSGAAVFATSSECPGHWCTLGGTSLSSPLIASVFALAGGAGGVPYPARTLYEHEKNTQNTLHDVTAGSNGECLAPFTGDGMSGCPASEEAERSCASQLICHAASGYDGPTGVGTPDGIGAFEPISGGEESQGSDPASAQPSAAVAPPAAGDPPPPGATTLLSIPPTAKVSALSLTVNAIVALNSGHPRISQVGFAFTINTVAHVRVVLALRVRAHGRTRWQTLPSSLTFAALKGRNSRRLSGKRILSNGVYRLTLTPSGGSPRSLVFQIG